MSIEAISWASRLDVPRSSTKFVLIALCNYCNDDCLAWPSIETLSKFTAQDRKTVMRAIKSLKELGLVEDTGRRVGATWGVNVYRIAVPKTVQLAPRSSTKFPKKQYRFSHQAVPKTVPITVREPLLTNNSALEKRTGKSVAIAEHLEKMKAAAKKA